MGYRTVGERKCCCMRVKVRCWYKTGYLYGKLMKMAEKNREIVRWAARKLVRRIIDFVTPRKKGRERGYRAR